MGVIANDPSCETLLVALPVSWNDHTAFSVRTFDTVMVEPTATRVFDRLPLGYGHDPLGNVAAEPMELIGAKRPAIVARTIAEITGRSTDVLFIVALQLLRRVIR
jgi:hypothetical protein